MGATPRVLLMSLAVVALVTAGAVVVLVRASSAQQAVPPRATPPLADGYLQLRPPGSYSRLPDDSAATAMVHRSAWEVRPGNAPYNRTAPPALRLAPRDNSARAYDPRWNTEILARVSGRFTGTTDEILQWAAAKWGLPDNLMRTVAVMESDWRQSNHGDEVTDQKRCPAGYRAPCPVTFGLVGTKSTSWPGIFPWNRDSTAAAADVLGGWLRGCYEGWVWWLRDHGSRHRGTYAAGDIWGCVGAWASGDWHDLSPQGASGERYLRRAQEVYAMRPWLEPGF